MDNTEGLRRCERCGELIERRIAWPVMDGTKRLEEKIMPVMCRCMREEEERERRKAKYEADMRAVNALKAESLLDARLANASLATYQRNPGNDYGYRVAERYVLKFPELLKKGQGLIFYGGVGTGKSYTAACIANALMEKRQSVIMTSFVKILSRAGNSGVSEDTIQRLNRPKLLILDDLGAERSTDYVVENVYNIIDSRYRSGKPLILTTNLTLEEMKTANDMRYQRIFDRVFSMCFPVRFVGESWRKASAVHRFDEMKKLFGDD